MYCNMFLVIFVKKTAFLIKMNLKKQVQFLHLCLKIVENSYKQLQKRYSKC